MFNIHEDLLSLPPEIRFKRIKDAGKPMAKIIPSIATFISDSQSVGNLCNLVSLGKNEFIELNEESIQRHINWIASRANYSSIPFVLCDNEYNKNGVSLSIGLGHYNNLETLWIKSNQKFNERGFASHQMANFFSVAGQEFDAFTGYVYNHVVAVFNNEKYLPPYQFDSSEVPQCISWINYWCQKQVENVGRDRTMNAGWFDVIELGNGAVITVATQDYSDLIGNPKHLECFEKISRTLNLRKLQEQSKPSEIFQMDSW